MSLVVSETSPRALLESALELSFTLNLISDDDGGEGATLNARPMAKRGPGFVLKEVESVLLQICNDLDLKDCTAGLDDVPLMTRLRKHIDSISTVLTGNKVEYGDSETTTLYELIESLSLLNKSVCTTERRSGCVIS